MHSIPKALIQLAYTVSLPLRPRIAMVKVNYARLLSHLKKRMTLHFFTTYGQDKHHLSRCMPACWLHPLLLRALLGASNCVSLAETSMLSGNVRNFIPSCSPEV